MGMGTLTVYINNPNPYYFYMVELEQLAERRDYKLVLLYGNKCLCGGMLWLFRDRGTIFQRCQHVGCMLTYEIIRICNICKWWGTFDKMECVNCEPIIKRITEFEVNAENNEKEIRRLRRLLRKKKIKQIDYDRDCKILEEDAKKCIEKAKELRNQRAIDKSLATQTSAQ